MKVKEDKDTYIISKVSDAYSDFILKLEHQYPTFKKHHLIIDLGKEAEQEDLLLFENLAKMHKKEKKSFILLVKQTDFTDFEHPLLNVVPSLQEAHDIIEMEEIERDLGF